MNKKILFLAGGCHPGIQGGIQTFGRTLQKMFYDNIIFLANKKKDKKIFKVDNVEEVSRGSFLFKVINRLLNNKLREKKLIKKIKSINPDICILRSPQDLKKLDGIKCKKILVQHTKLDRCYKNWNYYNSEINLFERSKEELSYFVVTSLKDRYILNEKYKFPMEKIKVIRHSCELDLLEKAKIRNKNLIMIGRLDNGNKRFDLAIRVMKKLPDFKLKIFGDGLDKKILEQIIIKEKLKNVFLCGPTDIVKNKLDESGILVITSDVEGYPITSIEAMRRGLPIILRNTFEGASDIVIDNGILLEKEWEENKFIEGIKKIYNNYDYYSKNSLKMGKRHDIKVIKKEWESIFYE